MIKSVFAISRYVMYVVALGGIRAQVDRASPVLPLSLAVSEVACRPWTMATLHLIPWHHTDRGYDWIIELRVHLAPKPICLS